MKRRVSLLLVLLLLSGAFEYYGEKAAAAEAGTVIPQLAAGDYFSAGIASDGTVWSWGRGADGQLGNGEAKNNASPVQVAGISGAKSIGSTYDSSYAVMNDGTVRAWGMGDTGQMGDGTTNNRLVPVTVPGLQNIKAVAGGPGLHGLAVGTDGSVWAWGANDGGQLGDGTTNQRNTPVQVPGLSGIKAAATGGSFSLALTEEGKVWSWGWNKQGQLGDGTSDQQRETPTPVPGLSGIVAISAGYNHALALDADGFVWAWGQNTNGAVGDGTYTERRSPVKIAGVDGVVSISAGFFHNLVLKADGTVWGWGLNNYYQLGLGGGDNVKRNAPTQIPGLSSIAAVAAGQFHSIAMDSGGSGWAWGYNDGGMLGDGTSAPKTYPVKNKANFDLTAPAPSDGMLAATGVTTSGVTLSWTRAADNMTKQIGIRYIPYISASGNIDTASHAQSNGKAAGSYLVDSGSFEMAGLQPDTAYYFNVIAEDLAGNKSAYKMLRVKTASIPAYTLTYDGNGNTGGAAPSDGSSYEQGMSTTIQGNMGLLFRSGYMFAGWNTAADGSGTPYMPGSQLTFDAADITLYAQWTPNSAADTEPPKVISTVPGSSAEGVSNGTKLSLTFDEPISAVAGRTIVVSRAEDDSPVEAVDASNPDRVTITGLTATIRLSSGLSYGTAYNIKVAPGAFKDAAGNDYAGITSRGAWTFTTAREAIDPDPGADATLKGLNVYAGAEFLPISPAFGRNTRDYAISLPNSVAGLTVTASVYESRAGMTVSMYDDSRRLISGPFPLADGQASGTLPVDLGRSRIELNVLAEDGTAQAYNIMVTRAAVYDVPPAEPPPEDECPDTAGAGDESRDEDNSADFSYLTVNSRPSGAATITKEDSEGRATVTVKLDAAKLVADLAKETAANPLVAVELDSAADQASLQLSGEALKALEDKAAVLELRAQEGSYRLPAAQLSFKRLTALLGEAPPPEEFALRLDIVRSSADKIAALNAAGKEANFMTIAQPLDFRVTASYGGKTVDADSFDAYVEREIALPGWMNPSLLSTAVVLDADGSVHPAPTRKILRNGHTLAVVSSMTGSTYSLIHHDAAFPDMAGHWAESAVSDLGSRLVVNGMSDGLFHPEAAVTRVQYAEMLVRALGLAGQAGAPGYKDVQESDWFAEAVSLARQYGLMEGGMDGLFRPEKTITREEAVTVLARAMKLTGLKTDSAGADGDFALADFGDSAQISDWARQAVATVVLSGLAEGADGMFRPLIDLKRAEAANLVQQLLQQSVLIDRR